MPNLPLHPLVSLRVLVITLFCIGLLSAQAQIGKAPEADEVSPGANPEVSSTIATDGSGGYDGWAGSAHRTIVDFEVTGAVSSHGLKWTRTYSSSNKAVWSFGYTWRRWGKWAGQSISGTVDYPDGRRSNVNTAGSKELLVEHYTGNNEGYEDLYLADGSVLRSLRTHDYVDTCLPTNPLCRNGEYEIIIPQYILDRYGRKTILIWEQVLAYEPSYPIDPYRLTKVIDQASGRWIEIKYGSNDPGRWHEPSEVRGSNGDWVKYIWQEGSETLQQVQYSDGTVADYDYLSQEYKVHYDAQSQSANVLWKAHDTRAVGAMRSIEYSYADGVCFRGQIETEKHPDSGALVSTFGNNSYRDTVAATHTETRGDGPSREIRIEKGASQVPLVKWKKDYKGVKEEFIYNSNTNYLTAFIDRKLKRTDYENESVIGNVKKITYPLTSSDTVRFVLEYEYLETPIRSGDPHNPYYVTSVTNERGKKTTYTRDPVTRAITRIDYHSTDADTPASFETFEYNSLAQVKTHRRKNGYYEHALYDETPPNPDGTPGSPIAGLLLKLWKPTEKTLAQISDADAHTSFSYYTSGPWAQRVQTVTDELGRRTTYEYDKDANGNAVYGRGLVTKITYPDDTHGGQYPNGTFKSFTYDQYGNKLTETDELGHTTTYTYDGYNRVTSVKSSSPINGLTINDYSPLGQNDQFACYTHTTSSIFFVTDAAGIITKNHYDPNWRKDSMTVGFGTAKAATTSYGYDNNGNQTSVTDPRALEPNNTTNFITLTGYDARNRKETITDAQNRVTRFHYDAASNITSIDKPDLTTEIKTYDALNRVKTHTVPKEASPAEVVTTTFVYNPSGTLQSVTVPQTAAISLTTTFEYDASDMKTKMTYPNGHTQEWTYDLADNMIARKSVQGAAELFSYDERDRKISMAWSNGSDWSSFDYDAAGRLIRAQNPTSRVTRGYDEANRLMADTQQLQIVPIAAVSRKTHGDAAFDVALPLSGNPGVECRTGGANNAHQIVITFPRSVTIGAFSLIQGAGTIASTSFNSDNTQLTINLTGATNGQEIIIALTDVSDGAVTNDVKIGMGVLLGDSTGDGSVNSADISRVRSQSGQLATSSTFRQDLNSDGVVNSADITMVRQASGTAFSIVPLIQPLPPTPAIAVQYGYDAANKVKQLLVTSAGYNYTFEYDQLGRFADILSGGTQLFHYDYDAASNEKQRLSLENGVAQIYTPDNLNRMEKREVKVGSNTISSETYGYDPMNRLTSIDRTEDNLVDSFGYNLRGELDWANYGQPKVGQGLGTPARPVDYVWDKSGNRTSVSDAGSLAIYSTTNLNQYWQVGTDPVTSNNQHALANYQNITYSYIGDRHLTSVTGNGNTYHLNYDALDRCVVRMLNGVPTYYIYDGEKPILEYAGSSYQLAAANVYGKGIDEILRRTDYTVTPNRVLYYQQDHQGSVTHLTNANGDVVESYRYDAFGKPTIKDGAGNILTSFATGLPESRLGNRFMFTGREYVPQFGIYEYRARAYHPGLGRFMSEDPKLFVRRMGMGNAPNDWSFGQHPDEAEYNLFRYCGNDPIDFVDPTGSIREGPLGPEPDITPEGRPIALAAAGIGLAPFVVAPAVEASAATGGTIGLARLGSAALARLGPTVVARLAPSGVIAKALASVKMDANRLNHIFGNPNHNLGGLLKAFRGAQDRVAFAVIKATEGVARAQGYTGQFTTQVTIAGEKVWVQGNVVNGVVRVNTFAVKASQ